MTRAQVRNLEERSALWVAKHLVMAGRLIDLDPELAFQHALAASRRGGRLAAVREAVGLTAYAAGHYGEALREFRTFRRISGSNVHLPIMADCERGLGRADRALDLARSEEAESLDTAGKVELAMVVAGARADLGQLDAAVAALEIPQLDLHRAFSFSPRLFRAYADALDAVGRSGESGTWRRQAGVAEKALGLDDDLEPDIIDLGEEDDEAPVPVPKVADVLGGSAGTDRGVATSDGDDDGASDDVESPASDDGDDDGASDDVESPASGGGDDGGAPDDVESPVDPVVDSEVDSEVDSMIDSMIDSKAGSEDDTDAEPSIDGLDLDGEGADAGSADGATSGQAIVIQEAAEAAADPGPSGDEPRGSVPVDAVPVGETAAPVEPLQTEMLFSMDDSGTSDISPSGRDDIGDPGEPSNPAVEFSEAASTEGTGMEPSVDVAAPQRTRVTRPKATQEDAADD
ncbi:hypothetical protein [Arthrobacter agilis]|uniref:hypothetical protein n=1 Tax=Arthrobacter agilis TaxID=37921 RepID=UPI001FC8F30D|nr:hypothetical protein [Arthrobacter agilis]